MSISSEQLTHLATLAYLDIHSSTTPQLMNDINAMMNFVAALRTVDTTSVEPLVHPIDFQTSLRPDEAIECHLTDALGKIAPQFQNNLYLVPKVIK